MHSAYCMTSPTPLVQLMGVVSLCIGLWLYVAFNEFATFSNGERLIGSVLLVAVGFGALIVGFLGIVAAMWESRIIATGVSLVSNTNSGRGMAILLYLVDGSNRTISEASIYDVGGMELSMILDIDLSSQSHCKHTRCPQQTTSFINFSSFI